MTRSGHGCRRGWRPSPPRRARPRSGTAGFWEKRRPKHLLTGLVVCGCCGHALAAVGQDYLRCARADRNDLCTNRTGIRRPVLEEIVIQALQHNLMQPELVEEFIAAFHAEVNRSRGTRSTSRRVRQGSPRSRSSSTGCHGHRQGLRRQPAGAADALETEKAELERTLPARRPPPCACIPTSPSSTARRWRRCTSALNDEATGPRPSQILRGLIERWRLARARAAASRSSWWARSRGWLRWRWSAAGPKRKRRPGGGGV